MTTPKDHRLLREALGAYALGALTPEESASVQAHLDGCEQCSAELEELSPVVAALNRMDPALVTSPATPPPGLGAAIVAQVAQERVLRDRRSRRASLQRGALRTAAAGAAAAALIGIGIALPYGDPAAPKPIPFEAISLRSSDPAVQVTSAGVVPHTWGIELKMTANGLAQGQTYRAMVRGRDGQMLSAGEFLGTGATPLVCNLQAAMLRDETRAVVVVDSTGRPVLSAELPA